jgi:RND family efflux transporter MFP subunit
LLASVEDSELREQVKQAEASFAVTAATIRQRDADLRFATTNLERAQNLFTRQLVPKQTLDDAEARSQAAMAQLDLARAQYEQSKARLDELNITLANTRILSPVDGFVGRRNLDPGAFVNSNSALLSVVDIHVVRLVVNLVEKDLRRVVVGAPTVADVDAYPNEEFLGRVARVAPVLDPNTRTAEMEIELPNPANRLKPGMYARVRLTTERRDDALVIPRAAIVDKDGKHGVFLYDDSEGGKARFREVESGLQDDKQVEIVKGLSEGDPVITTGASALADGDTVLLPGSAAPEPGGVAGSGSPGDAGRSGERGGRDGGRRGQGGGRGGQTPPGPS